jgi:hypothetical protein
MSNKPTVPGVILIVTCHKHFQERIPRHKPCKSIYYKWPIVYCMGDPSLPIPWTIMKSAHSNTGDLILLQCEDSYIHLLKKLTLALCALQEIYHIQEGVLKIGDDIYLNEQLLLSFLSKTKKSDFVGHNYMNKSFDTNNTPHIFKKTRKDVSMIYYFNRNLRDFQNPVNGLTRIDVSKMTLVPELPCFAIGTVFYLSNNAIQSLITEMKNINFNIFYKDPETGAWNYIIEDIALTYIMFKHGISLVNDSTFFANSSSPNPSVMCTHTAVQGHYITEKIGWKFESK